MAGRAGRAGIDTHGECILVNQDIGLAAGERLFTSGAAPVQSCLVDDKKGGWVGCRVRQVGCRVGCV
jgi:replicative superfamily II helicase